MLSILIPVYNYNCTALVKEVHKQAVSCKIDFEILVLDDGSYFFIEENSVINSLPECTFISSSKNLGRSSTRNALALKSKYETLLFIDAGTFPSNENFIKLYVKNSHHNIVIGGMTYLKKPPKKPYKLRWIYTKKRESVSQTSNQSRPIVCSSNFLIQKKIFNTNLFDESLIKYGCEDVLFFDAISKKGIISTYINNPVIHDSQDNADNFIKKTEFAIENLTELINVGKLNKDRYMISILYYKLNKFKIDPIISLTFKLLRNMLKKNFNSTYPSILLFDFYRLGYFCFLKNKK